MKTLKLLSVIVALGICTFTAHGAVSFNVSGTSSPWLAGMPNGSTGGGGDTAPAESPLNATDIQVSAGAVFTFSANGGAFNYPCCGSVGPEGDMNNIYKVSPLNGMSDITAPIVALLGVFLDDNVPSGFSPPPGLDFSTAAARDFLTLQPSLRQPFFIGDGLTSGGVTQQFVAPVGATRFFLGIMDNICYDNSGGFSVTVTNSNFCSPHRATALASLASGVFVGASLLDLGCGYTNAPSVRIVGGGGSGAGATAELLNGHVVSINVTNGGCCYTNPPKILIESPPFVPTVGIAVSKVKVTQTVRVNHNYILEASYNLQTWTATGPQFTADSESVVNEFDVDAVGRYFRLLEVP